MKLIICVKSCQRDLERGFHDIIRETWGRDAKALGIDVRFFVAAPVNEHKAHQTDEVHLDCSDTYETLSYKTRRICQWATGKMVDYIFLCDTDTFLSPKKMLKCGFQGYDYVGKISRPLSETFRYVDTGRDGTQELHEHCYPWASGGYGYFLSKTATAEVAYEPPNCRAEDLWVGQVLGPLIKKGELTGLDTPAEQYSWHHPQHGEIYETKQLRDWMTKMHAEQA